MLTEETRNVVHLSVCFMILFSSSLTMVYMQKSIVSSISDDNKAYNVDGYVTLGLGYFVFGVSTLVAPRLVISTEPRILFMICCSLYILNPLSFLVENLWVTYISTVLVNISSGFIWVAHANYLTSTSSKGNLPRNIGIFWFIYSWATAVGSLYGVVVLKGETQLCRSTRASLLSVLSGLAAAALVLFFFLRSPPKPTAQDPPKATSMKATWEIFCTKPMIVLMGSFLYTGFQQALGSAVLGPSIGFSKQFGDMSTQLISISGVCYGLGEVLGGVVQMVSSRLMNGKQWRPGFVLIGYVLESAACIFIACSLPNSSVFHDTTDKGLLPINWGMALVLVASVLLGYGDSALNIQMYPLMGDLQPGQSSHTTALYKFTKNMAVSAYFYLSTQVGLRDQMYLLLVSGAVSVFTYFIVDRWSRQDSYPDTQQEKCSSDSKETKPDGKECT